MDIYNVEAAEILANEAQVSSPPLPPIRLASRPCAWFPLPVRVHLSWIALTSSPRCCALALRSAPSLSPAAPNRRGRSHLREAAVNLPHCRESSSISTRCFACFCGCIEYLYIGSSGSSSDAISLGFTCYMCMCRRSTGSSMSKLTCPRRMMRPPSRYSADACSVAFKLISGEWRPYLEIVH